MNRLRSKFVKFIYADHNNTKIVKEKLKYCLDQLKNDDFGINIGSGTTKIHKNVKNLDIFPGKNIDYIATAECIPVIDNFFTIAIAQEVLEHVQNPIKACEEIYRVLKKDGIFYCQIPFIIGFHPGPKDYWRFTKEGIEELLKYTGFDIIETGITVGAGTGFYRISVEFFAGIIAIFIPKLYILSKAFFFNFSISFEVF